jgi:hypothetical protein
LGLPIAEKGTHTVSIDNGVFGINLSKTRRLRKSECSFPIGTGKQQRALVIAGDIGFVANDAICGIGIVCAAEWDGNCEPSSAPLQAALGQLGK